jgi:oxygen-independent coproporphyrinogen-3 oxidase
MADDLLGLGVSAISQIGDFYLQNERNLDDYHARLEEGRLPIDRGCKITLEDKYRRQVIMALISDLKLDIPEFNQQFGIDFDSHFREALEALEPLRQDGLITVDPQGIQVTGRGRPFLRNICMPFDAYLQTHRGDQPQPRYSATL